MAVTSITPANPQAPAPVPAPAPGAESRSPTPRPEPAVADPLLDAGQLPGPPSPASSPPPQTYAPTATQGPAEGQKLPAEVAEGGQPVQRQPGLPPGKGPDGLGPPGLRQDGAVTPGPGGGGGGENWGQIIISLPGLGGRAVLTVQQAQAQTVWAQQVLAQALGRLAAGQMGAGAAALALAQGQLALREGRRCCHRLWLRGHGAAGCVGRFAI